MSEVSGRRGGAALLLLSRLRRLQAIPAICHRHAAISGRHLLLCVPVCVPLWLWSLDKSLGDIELTAVLGATTGRARERVDRVLFSTVPSHFTCWQGALAQMALRAAVGLAACLPGWQLTMAKVSSVLKQAQLLKHSLAFFPSLPFPLPPPMFD